MTDSGNSGPGAGPKVVEGQLTTSEAEAPTRRRMIQASFWSMGGFAIGQIIRFGANLILTRLLFPESFGLYALVTTFLLGLQMFADIGTGPAIVHSPHGDDERFLNTVWTLQTMRGAVLTIAYLLIAKPVAFFYHQPLLATLISVAGISALIEGFSATSVYVAQRHLRQQWQSVLDLTAQVANLATILTLAVVFRGYFQTHHLAAAWTSVAGGLVSDCVKVFVSHKIIPGIRHRFLIDRNARRTLVRFSRFTFLSTLLMYLASQADRLILGKKIPLALLGVYGIAVALASIPPQAIVRIGASVLFPAFSRLVHRPDFKKAYLRARYPLMLAGGVTISGLIACGPALIRVLYDRRYHEAGWTLQYLAVASWFQILESINNPALLALGRFGWQVVNNLSKLASFVILVPLGFRYGGFQGMLIALAASDLVKYVVAQVGIASRGLATVPSDALYTVVVAAVSAGGFWLGALADSHSGGNNILNVLASGSAVCSFWGILGLAYWRKMRAARTSVNPAVP
jgi:O-antigen/teichoic acid export membrane protein